MRVSSLFIPLLLGTAICVAFSTEAEAQTYAGEWRAGPLQVRNATRSWGADCPQRLPATQTEAGGTVQVAQSGDHLTLSGAVRGNTRSCWSDNPSLRRISSRYQDGAWTIICRTPENDARAESARYAFSAASSTQITFRETTEWNWQLNESVCQVTRTATRTFTRADGLVAEPTPEPDPEPVPEPERPACTPGAPAGVRLSPGRSEANVGQRVCFSSRVVDSAGCTVRGERVRLQLRPPEGVEASLSGRCFEPSALGLYSVVATNASFTARASLEVTSNDLSDLVAQRDGAGPLDSNGHAEGAGSSGVEASALGGSSLPLYGGLGVLAALLLGGILLLVSRKKKSTTSSDDDSLASAAPTLGVPAAYVPPPKPPKVCPRCGHEDRGETNVCPNDGVALIDLNDEAIRLRGKICPKCRTGHAAGTALCPNDQTPLVYHVLYEAQQKEASAKKNVCSSCGNSYDAGVGFCPEDGTRLG